MKPWHFILIALALMLGLCSCQNRSTPDGPPPPPPVPAQPYRIALFKLGGDQEWKDVPTAAIKEGMKLFQFEEGPYYSLQVVDLGGSLDSFPSRLAETIGNGADLIAISHPRVLQAALGLEVAKPIVFGVVGDPLVLGAGAAPDHHRPGLTGAYHALPSQGLLATIKFHLPKAKRVGVLFNGREPLSVAHKDALVRDSAHAKLEILALDSGGGDDLLAATDTLLNQSIDALGLAAGLGAATAPTIEQARTKRIPVFGLNEIQARQGALAVEVPSLDRVGLETGRMIYRVLSGEQPTGIPFAPIIDTEAVVNPKAAEALAITLPVGALRISRPLDE